MAKYRMSSLAMIIMSLPRILTARGRTVKAIFIYLLTAILISAAGFFLYRQYGDTILTEARRFIFPEEWEPVIQPLVDYLIKTQAITVLANALTGVFLVLISAVLFPLKEKISYSFEQQKQMSPEKVSEFGLFFQAWEEVKLVLSFAALQMSVFWLGYHTDPYRKIAADVLSYGLLFTIFSFDFIPPLLQRHRQSYASIGRVIWGRPLLLFGFGAVFTLPLSYFTGLMLEAQWQLPYLLAALLGMNLIVIIFGILAGTWVAGNLLPEVREAQPFSPAVRGSAAVIILLLLAANTYVFSLIGESLYKKTQVLKCEYTIVPDSFSFKLPQFTDGSWAGLAAGALTIMNDEDIKIKSDLKLKIKNPTEYDVLIEDSYITFKIDDTEISRSDLSEIEVGAGRTEVSDVTFTSEVEYGRLADLLTEKFIFNLSKMQIGLESIKKLEITLHLQVREGFTLPVYLVSYHEDGFEL